jgi:hypothetical protein
MNRRTVIRRAVKLAYATPLIVAVLDVHEANASEVGCSCGAVGGPED